MFAVRLDFAEMESQVLRNAQAMQKEERKRRKKEKASICDCVFNRLVSSIFTI